MADKPELKNREAERLQPGQVQDKGGRGGCQRRHTASRTHALQDKGGQGFRSTAQKRRRVLDAGTLLCKRADQRSEALHLIDEELAVSYLVDGQVERFRLALASKPFDAFFLCHVPSQNLDNEWNASALIACEQAKSMWVQVTSRKADGIDGYQTRMARDTGAFPEPQWPTQSLTQLLEVTFANRMIDHENHPGLLRLIGARQELG